jgi:virginiamycin A acetyltransferase
VGDPGFAIVNYTPASTDWLFPSTLPPNQHCSIRPINQSLRVIVAELCVVHPVCWEYWPVGLLVVRMACNSVALDKRPGKVVLSGLGGGGQSNRELEEMAESTTIHVPAPAISSVKESIKAAARLVALLFAVPVLVGYWLGALILGRNRALESTSQLLSLVPGITGQYLRRAVLQRVLARCSSSAMVEFGTLFSQSGTVIDENVYVGPRCQLGLVHLERDVLIAANVQIPSGGKTHYFDDPARPIREQGGERRMVTIGAGAWVGTGAIVLADVGRGTVVAAGSVVTKPLPDGVIAAGVPARVLRSRFAREPIHEPSHA